MIFVKDISIKELKNTATQMRMKVIDMIYKAQSGHPGGSLSIADILTYLYFHRLNIDPKNPQWEDRDRLVMSKGHAAPAYYSVLAHRGYFPVEELKTLRKSDSRLQGHPNMRTVPGVDASTGSLGQGISVAVGMALGAKLSGKSFRVYTILGDGEIQEGQVWEAAMYACAKGLDNLVAVVDNNNLQIDGTIAEVNSPYPIAEKFKAFGWNVLEIYADSLHEIDGHDMDTIEAALSAPAVPGKPKCILAHTVKGKGVSFMENQCSWHGKAPNEEQYKEAMEELNATLTSLEAN